MLHYLGQKHLENTARQYYTEPDLHNNVINISQDCYMCKINKPNLNNYDHLPAKIIDYKYLQHTIYIDIISPCAITNATSAEFKLRAMTMIDSSAGWFEMSKISNKTAKMPCKRFTVHGFCAIYTQCSAHAIMEMNSLQKISKRY